METITCELNGIKYLLVERLVTDENSDEIDRKNKKYDCIYQGISKMNTEGFFTKAHMIVKILVPEKNVIAWSRETD